MPIAWCTSLYKHPCETMAHINDYVIFISTEVFCWWSHAQFMMGGRDCMQVYSLLECWSLVTRKYGHSFFTTHASMHDIRIVYTKEKGKGISILSTIIST